MSAASISHPRLAGGFRRRMRHLGWVLPMLGLQIVGAVLFVLFIVAMPLTIITIGIPLIIAAVFLTRAICTAERTVLRLGFGIRIERPYQRWPKGHIGTQLVKLSKDVTVWRDFGWQAVNNTLGLAVYSVYIGLVGGAAFALLQPFLYRSWPQVFDNFFGLFYYDSFGEAWLYAAAIALLYLFIWWTAGELMITGYAKLAELLLRPTHSAKLEQRVVELTTSRAETVDSSAAELRRIERDLHDGAQARLVALGMSLGMAEEVLKTDPDAAAALLAEARENSGEALSELRNLVRGIHPPVLADRGLPGAVEALALAHPLPVTVVADLPGRLPEPVETAAYFAVAEALTNAAKYAQASAIRVRIGYFGTRLGIMVRDDGIGGASMTVGGGLDGLAKRLAAFDGTVEVSSPPGGPTVVSLEVPCSVVPPAG